MPLVADFADVISLFSNGDLEPVTLERWVPGQARRGTPLRDGAANRYADQGQLDPCFWVPDGAGEFGQSMPAGDRPRERIRAYCTAEVRAGRGSSLQADVLRLADGRRYKVTSCRRWDPSGNFFEVGAELIDE